MIPISMMFTSLQQTNETPTKSVKFKQVLKKSWPPKEDDIKHKKLIVNGKTKIDEKKNPHLEVSDTFNDDNLFINKRCG